MEQRTDRKYSSASLENFDLEQRLEKNLKDVNSFNNHINNIKEMITLFKVENHKSKKKNGNYKTLNTLFKPIDTITIIVATSTPITLSISSIVLNILSISAGIACTLSIYNKVLHKIIKKNKMYAKNSTKKINKLLNPSKS